MREIRMLRSNGRQLETEPGRTLHGHEAGNGGYSQGDAYRHRASSRPYLSLSRDPYSVRERETGNPSTTALGPPSNSALTLSLAGSRPFEPPERVLGGDGVQVEVTKDRQYHPVQGVSVPCRRGRF